MSRQQHGAKTAPGLNSTAAAQTIRTQKPPDIAEEDIRIRAFQLWEQAGRPGGQDQQLWAQAEREVRALAANR